MRANEGLDEGTTRRTLGERLWQNENQDRVGLEQYQEQELERQEERGI